MPDHDEYVLVVIDNMSKKFRARYIGLAARLVGDWIVSGSTYNQNIGKITHWMQPPELPED